MLPYSVHIPLVLFGHLFREVEEGAVSVRSLSHLNFLLKSFLNKPIEISELKVSRTDTCSGSLEYTFRQWGVLIVLDDRHRLRVRSPIVSSSSSTASTSGSSSPSHGSGSRPSVEMPVSHEPHMLIIKPGSSVTISWKVSGGEGLRLMRGSLTRELKTRELRLSPLTNGKLGVRELFGVDELQRLWVAVRRELSYWKRLPLVCGGDEGFESSLKQRLIYQWLINPSKAPSCDLYFLETTAQLLKWLEEVWTSKWKYMMLCPISAVDDIDMPKGGEWLGVGTGLWEEPGGTRSSVKKECVRGYGAWLVGLVPVKKIPE